MAEVLNLNNEVVKMRKEVKKARALVIRKLTRQISALKKKKGKEAELVKNQRRVARLLEEINEMKILKPDSVTKTALQKNLVFEKVCKDPSSTLTDRATARIATHPQISKRILDIKAAIAAFKEARRRPAAAKKAPDSAKPVEDSKNDVVESGHLTAGGGEKATLDVTAVQKQSTPVDEPAHGTSEVAELTSPDTEVTVKRELSNKVEILSEKDTETSKSLENSSETSLVLTSLQTVVTKDDERQEPVGECCSEAELGPETEEEEEKSDSETSSGEEEKEYFDDSTEERFHKQSSQSEDSDGDDFFLGKVRKFRKRKTESGPAQVKSSPEAATSRSDPKVDTPVQRGDERNDKQDSKLGKLKSVFCGSLSGSKGASLGRGRSPLGGSKPSMDQKFKGGPGGGGKPSRFDKPKGDGKPRSSTFGSHTSARLHGNNWVPRQGQAVGKGRPPFRRHEDRRAVAGKAPNPSQNAQQALHPSWEASKRRKEQRAQITAFQGKKIKFDDD